MGLQGTHGWPSSPYEKTKNFYYFHYVQRVFVGNSSILPLCYETSMQNRRTDDPSEQDRSESYSIKQQKTYDWKQENIRGGKLPPKPQKPPAKKASQVHPQFAACLHASLISKGLPSRVATIGAQFWPCRIKSYSYTGHMLLISPGQHCPAGSVKTQRAA